MLQIKLAIAAIFTTFSLNVFFIRKVVNTVENAIAISRRPAS